MKKLFEKWLSENYLSFVLVQENVYLINNLSFLLLKGRETVIDQKFSLVLDKEENFLLEDVQFIVYLWGDKFYYTPKDKVKNPEFNLLRYLGRLEQGSYPFLGVHGKYELLNGSRDYSLWCKKASFLNIKTLGISEKNTLAGTLDFQEECKKNQIKPIIGETITIKSNDDFYVSKVFVVNETGWKNLLLINTEINVNNSSRYITEEKLLELSTGLIFVFHPAYFPFSENRVKHYSSAFSQCYFQLDSCEYNNIETDNQFIIETNKYLKSHLKPVLINDAYYLEKNDYEIKSTLNMISGERDLLSNDQWFKTFDENLVLLQESFENDNGFENVITQSVESLLIIESTCNFQIETGRFKLPQYKMTKEEKRKYKTNENMFLSLIEEAFVNKVVDKDLDFDAYSERLEKEVETIKKGGFEDYFLILWDIVRFCKENHILTGIGRGSAGGSLISYLLDITRINPMPYKLLFERFINEGRMGKIVKNKFIEITLNTEEIISFQEDEIVKIIREDNEIEVKSKDILITDKIL